MPNDHLPFSSVWMQHQKAVQRMENESFETSHRQNRRWKKIGREKARKKLEATCSQSRATIKSRAVATGTESIHCADISKYLSSSTFKMFDGIAGRKDRYIKVSSREYGIESEGKFTYWGDNFASTIKKQRLHSGAWLLSKGSNRLAYFRRRNEGRS